MPTEQLQFEFFASLDFPGREALKLGEIATRLGLTVQHLFNEIESGELVALDAKAKGVSRRCIRVPVECYRDYVIRHITNTARLSLLKGIPPAALTGLLREIWEIIPIAARGEFLRENKNQKHQTPITKSQ
jgi:hypothetical protein